MGNLLSELAIFLVLFLLVVLRVGLCSLIWTIESSEARLHQSHTPPAPATLLLGFPLPSSAPECLLSYTTIQQCPYCGHSSSMSLLALPPELALFALPDL